ncbi:MAG TPA: BTAD domain-containing putative transcriptional regulator [Gemmatimonadaceae bacterium]|nr:BTAD domain-containing putative transcriptional regulator [Gemmatimonadaceae bacterium]
MIELSLLGLHALRGSDGREITSLPAQPKRFALLAYLAVSGGGGYHRRDTLAAMFWPDLDQFAARRALRNTLYHLRDALGEGAIITRGDDAVSIDPARLTCDVTRLQDAVQAGRYEEAVDWYHGELLPGIHFASAGEEFEEWLSRERLRVAELVTRAIRALVEREEQAGNVAGAAYWAQRACALAPGDEGWLRRAMTLFDAGSDPGSALRLYDAFTRRLATDFDAKPSAEAKALAARIRDGSRQPAARPGLAAPPTQDSVTGDGEVHAAAADGPSAPAAALIDSAAASTKPRTTRVRRAVVWGVLACAAAAVVLLVVRAKNARQSGAADTRKRALVAVFDNRTGDSSLQSLGRMTQDWIAEGLLRTRLVDVVDPHAVFVQSRTGAGAPVDPITVAHRTGADMLVSGSYYRTGDTLFLQAAVTDVGTGRIVRAVGPIFANVRTPVAALDELRSRVMTALASAVDSHSILDPGEGEVPPFDAYQAYVEGWDTYWHGDGRHAEALFLQAAHRDTGFVAAAIAAATTGASVNDCALVDSVARALDARSQPLGRIHGLSLQIAVARCHGRNDEMLRLALERADLEPRSSDVQLSAAAAALWADRPQRALDLLERINPQTDLGWSTDTTHFDYWSDLTEALHLLGRHDEELAAAGRIPASAPLSRAWMRGRALAALSRPTAALAVIDSALTLPVEMTNLGLAPYTDGRPQYTATPGWVANWIARELAVHGDAVAAHQAAARAIAWYRSRPLDERSTPEERLVASWSLEMLGAYPEAIRMARQLVAEDSTNVDYRGELAGLAAETGDSALAESLDRWLAAQPVSRVGWTASLYRARVAALLGHGDVAVARVRDAIDEGAWPLWIHFDPGLASLRGRADFIELTAPHD